MYSFEDDETTIVDRMSALCLKLINGGSYIILDAYYAYENARRLFEVMKLEHLVKKCDDKIRDLEM